MALVVRGALWRPSLLSPLLPLLFRGMSVDRLLCHESTPPIFKTNKKINNYKLFNQEIKIEKQIKNVVFEKKLEVKKIF